MSSPLLSPHLYSHLNSGFVLDRESPEPESVQKMRYFHRVVQMDLEARGDKVFRYKYPNPFMFAVTAVGMFFAVDLALAAGPFASDFSRDVAAPPHWAIIRSLTGGRIDLESIHRTIFDFIVGKSFTGNTLLSFAATAWLSLARVRDARKVLKLCRSRMGADAGVSMRYAVGVFLCGMAQKSSLQEEKSRIDRLNRLDHVGYEIPVTTPPLGKFQPSPRAKAELSPGKAVANATKGSDTNNPSSIGGNVAGTTAAGMDNKVPGNGSFAAVVNTLQRYSSGSPASTCSVVESETLSHGCVTDASASTSPAIVPAKAVVPEEDLRIRDHQLDLN